MSLPPGVALVLAGGVVVVQRAAELALARRNEVWARAHGAVEHGAGHYPWIVALHAGWLVGWIGEAWFRGPVLSPWWPALVVAFLAGTASSPIRVFVVGLVISLIEQLSTIWLEVRWSQLVVFLVLLAYLVSLSIDPKRIAARLRAGAV